MELKTYLRCGRALGDVSYELGGRWVGKKLKGHSAWMEGKTISMEETWKKWGV